MLTGWLADAVRHRLPRRRLLDRAVGGAIVITRRHLGRRRRPRRRRLSPRDGCPPPRDARAATGSPWSASATSAARRWPTSCSSERLDRGRARRPGRRSTSCGTGGWHVGEPMDRAGRRDPAARRLRPQPRTGPGSSTPAGATTTTWCSRWTRQPRRRRRPRRRAGCGCSATSIPVEPGARGAGPVLRWGRRLRGGAAHGRAHQPRTIVAAAAAQELRPTMTRQPLVAKRAEELLGSSVVATAPVAGGDISTATRLRLSDGTTALMKTHPHAARGLLRRRGARAALAGRGRRDGGVAVPEVLAADHECLILRWVEPGKTTVDAAAALRPALAATHAAGADGVRRASRTASSAGCPLPNRTAPTWAEFYADPAGAALPQAGPRPRRTSPPRTAAAVESRDRPARRPAARGAARPAARRPLERQRALGPRRPRAG